ncbi:GlxA family transcriptional regulator [Kitasatospora sp. NPDC052896]|uniref:GlxA family transcriptional regulator n=1 Tax=Kitasatospora sp. NPDC052896 TaxID=3364061 RepID=UPI0037CC11F5
MARKITVASLHTGAFLLAKAGLLEGTISTTHWREAERLTSQYPGIDIDPHILFTDHGQVLTSAGATAGLDLCLHLVSRDHGATAAAAAARLLVLPQRRSGQAAQILTYPTTEDRYEEDPFQRTLEWLHRNLHRRLTLPDIAKHARMSVRQLHRRFKEGTGTTPLQWLLWARIERARQLLETTDPPIEQVATISGFGSAISLRSQFRQRLDTNPTAYRRTYRHHPHPQG